MVKLHNTWVNYNLTYKVLTYFNNAKLCCISVLLVGKVFVEIVTSCYAMIRRFKLAWYQVTNNDNITWKGSYVLWGAMDEFIILSPLLLGVS